MIRFSKKCRIYLRHWAGRLHYHLTGKPWWMFIIAHNKCHVPVPSEGVHRLCPWSVTPRHSSFFMVMPTGNDHRILILAPSNSWPLCLCWQSFFVTRALAQCSWWPCPAAAHVMWLSLFAFFKFALWQPARIGFRYIVSIITLVFAFVLLF